MRAEKVKPKESKVKKPRKPGRFSLWFGLLCLFVSVVLAVGFALSVKGILPPSIKTAVEGTAVYVGFHIPFPYALLPPCVFLFLLGILTFVFRQRKPFTFFAFPVLALQYATVDFLVGMKFGSSHPAALYDRLMAGGITLRMASLKVTLCLLLEMVVLFLVLLGANSLNAKWRRKHLFKEKLDAAKEPKPEVVETQPAVSRKERKRLAREEKKQRKEAERLARREQKKAAKAEKKANAKKTKEKAKEEETIVTVPVTSLPDDGGLHFPDVAEVPDIEHLKRRNEPVEEKKKEEPQPEEPVPAPEMEALTSPVVSTGALEAIKKEMERGSQAEEAPKKTAPSRHSLSGFLQGALEAVGRTPREKRQKQSEMPVTTGKGLLVEAVEANQKKNADIASMGSSFSKNTLDPEKEIMKPVQVQEQQLQAELRQRETVTPEPQKPAPAPVPQPAPVQHPVVQPVKTESPEPAKQEQPDDEEADMLECQSGVGGLASAAGGASALLNRQKLVYHYPTTGILKDYPSSGGEIDDLTKEKGDRLIKTLDEFHVQADLINIIKGPTVTMYEILPAPGVRVNQIMSLSDNIQLSLPARQVRIVAPIPGKSAVGVEVPNDKRDTIGFKEMLPALDLKSFKIPMILGKNLLGDLVAIDVASAPHLLIAGATGSGKSVCVNSLICSILYRKSPKQVRLIMVDPKIVELQIYNGIPHLLTPVITEPKRTLKALDFCLGEMERRYKMLQGLNTRNIVGYNEKVKEGNLCREELPYIVVIIDEFADLMHTVGKEMEAKVSRLTAMSRAVGIHLVLATQRPSVDVITGVIKTNIPSRIAFAVTSNTDSRIIIDGMGAEKLLGKGDMLYVSASDPSATRIQGAFLSDGEVEKIVEDVSKEGEPDYISEDYFEDKSIKDGDDDDDGGDGEGEMIGGEDDDEALMAQALQIVVERKCASASYLQRRLRIGFNRASRLVEEMEEQGYVGPPNGSKARPLLRYPGSVSVGQQDAGNVVTGDEQK